MSATGIRAFLHPEAPPRFVDAVREAPAATFSEHLAKSRRDRNPEDWGFDDAYRNPQEHRRAVEYENDIVDLEPDDVRPHKPGYHMEKAARDAHGDAAHSAYVNPDGTFKGGFDGAVRYFEHQGYSHEAAVKIAGKIAAEKRAHKSRRPVAKSRERLCKCPRCGHVHDAMRKATDDRQQQREASEGLRGMRAAERALRDDVRHERSEQRRRSA